MILIYQIVQKTLESTKHNFLMQVINDWTRRYALLDLLLINKEQMFKNVMVKDSLGYHKHDAVEFIICKVESKKKNQSYIPGFQKSKCWSV